MHTATTLLMRQHLHHRKMGVARQIQRRSTSCGLREQMQGVHLGVACAHNRVPMGMDGMEQQVQEERK
jgi:hypothetical protein